MYSQYFIAYCRYDPSGPTPNFLRGQENGTESQAQLGSDALLDCRVTALEENLVSWIFVQEERSREDDIEHDNGESSSTLSTRHHHRRRKKKPNLVVLTVGFKPHSAENRFILDFEPPNNYRLRIRNVQWRDEGR